MIVFALLSSRPGNNVVYYPNRILKGMDPFETGFKTRNPFSWIKEAVSSSEQDVIAMSGVDTAVYFVFLSTGLSFYLSTNILFSVFAEALLFFISFPIILVVAWIEKGVKNFFYFLFI